MRIKLSVMVDTCNMSACDDMMLVQMSGVSLEDVLRHIRPVDVVRTMGRNTVVAALTEEMAREAANG